MRHSSIISALLFFATILPPFVYGQDKQTAVFPDENKNIIFIEGEDAVSTNFAVEPTLYYGASKSRTLQLNRSESLEGGSPFFAEYVLYVEEGGTFRFFYGGTPAGPREDVSTSYTSPFRLTVDDGEPVSVYRRDMNVRGVYIPSYYWCDLGPVSLEKGIHRLKIEVDEKRKYDGKYYFYLDNLFLIREEALAAPGGPLPDVFPPSLSAETDLVFSTIPQYEERISEEPQNTDHYEQLAFVYTLVGDYPNALRILQRAQLVQPENALFLILEAKNRIWNGDIAQGLSVYKEVLGMAPERKSVWAEAGKVAAWTGNYQESIFFYEEGLSYHPKDLGLTVNLGMTHLWQGEVNKAEDYFQQAYTIAEESESLMEDLASIFRVNGYPEKAVEVYRRGTELFPEAIGFYLELEELYSSLGKTEEAKEVIAAITNTFVMSDRLQQFIDTFHLKQNLREEIIEDYVQHVRAAPDNLELRKLLVQTYLWNGKRDSAIKEYLNMLSNYAYRHFRDFYDKSSLTMQLLDTAYIYYSYFNRFSASFRETKQTLTSLYSEYEQALKEYQRYREKLESEDDTAEDPTIEERLDDAEEKLRAFMIEQQKRIETLERSLFRYDESTRQITETVKVNEQEQEAFAAMLEEADWKWARGFFIEELEATYKREPVLAGHVLGKIFQVESKLQSSEMFLADVSEEESRREPTIVALAETLLWRGKWDRFTELRQQNEALIQSNMPYDDQVMEVFTLFDAEDENRFIALSPDTAVEQVGTLGAALDEKKNETDELLDQIREDLATLHSVLYEQMERQFYYLEAETHPVRFELGKLYLEEENLVEATKQFEKVLDVDPWNIDAKFNLGVVRQRYGDWGQAMRKYREVYNENPFYPNVAAYYNQLARSHPDSFSVNTQLTGDPQQILLSGGLSFLNNVTTLFSWKAGYDFRSVRLFRTYGDERDGSYQTHTISVGVPINLYFMNMKVTPSAGLAFSSELFKPDVDETFPDFERSLYMEEYLGYWSVHPVLSGTVSYTPDFFTAEGTYTFEAVNDTFFPGRDILFGHTAELSLLYSFAGLHVPFLKYSSLRGYGKMQFIEDGNIIGNASEEGVFGIHLFDTPWTTLNITQTVSFGHSKTPSSAVDNGYWATDTTLLVKGGIYASSWFALPGDNSLGASLTATGGGYWDKLLAEEPENPTFQLEAVGRVDFNKNQNNYYLSIAGAHNWDTVTGDPGYWSLSVYMGVDASVLSLLAP